MYPVSDRFLEAIRQSGKRKTVVDVYYGIGDDTQLIAADLPVVSGQLTIDGSSNNRRSGTMVIGDPDLFPNLLNGSPIEPYGAELHIRTGVVYPNNEEELIPLGRFPIYTITGREEGGQLPEVKFFDRSKKIGESGYLARGGDYSGKRCKDRISYLAGYTLTSVTIVYGDDIEDVKLPGGTTMTEDHWTRIKKLAETMSAEVFFDVEGQLIIRTPPYVDESFPEQSAVWTVNGGEMGSMITLSRSISRENTFNRIGVYGATPDGNGKQPYAQASDDNPASPTYFLGPFGKVTRSYQYPTLTRPSQCYKTAEMLLRQHLGLSRSVDFGALCNPALDAGDILLFDFPSDGVHELHIVDNLTIPFNNGPMTGKTRTIQYVG